MYSNQDASGDERMSKGEEMLALMRTGHGNRDLVGGPAMDIKRRAKLVCLRFCWARQKKKKKHDRIHFLTVMADRATHFSV